MVARHVAAQLCHQVGGQESGLQCSRLSEDSGPAGLETGDWTCLGSEEHGRYGRRIYIIVYMNKELPWHLTPWRNVRVKLRLVFVSTPVVHVHPVMRMAEDSWKYTQYFLQPGLDVH